MCFRDDAEESVSELCVACHCVVSRYLRMRGADTCLSVPLTVLPLNSLNIDQKMMHVNFGGQFD